MKGAGGAHGDDVECPTPHRPRERAGGAHEDDVEYAPRHRPAKLSWC